MDSDGRESPLSTDHRGGDPPRRQRRIAAGVLLALLLTPHVLHLRQPFFMDERPILQNVLHFLSKATVVPLHALYPTFYSYLVTPFVALGVRLRALGPASTETEALGQLLLEIDPLSLALPARCISLAALLLTAWTLLRLLTPRYGSRAGLAAAVALLSAPALLSYGAYALPDVTAMAWVSLVLAGCCKLLASDTGRIEPRWLFAACAAAGLSIATKYTALPSLALLGATLVLLMLRRDAGTVQTSTRALLGWTALGTTVVALSFLIGSPGWVLATESFVKALRYEMQHAKDGHLGFSGVPGLGQLELLLVGAPVLTVVAALGAAAWWRERSAPGWLAVSSILATLALAASSRKQSVQYLFPALPGLCCLVAAAVSRLEAQLARPGAPQRAALIVAATLSAQVALCLYSAPPLLRPRSTDVARAWVLTNVPARARLALDWGYVPRFYTRKDWARLSGSKLGPYAEAMLPGERLFNKTRLSYDPAWLASTDADYLITSSAVYDRYFESGWFTARVPPAELPLGQQYRAYRRFYESLFESSRWQEIYRADTGNGPLTRVFRRVAEQQAAR